MKKRHYATAITIADDQEQSPSSNAPSCAGKLASELPIVGLGCSSFSNFFSVDGSKSITLPLDPTHPVIIEWMNTVREAIRCGINLLDTAPWYGHGMSECLIGLALTYDNPPDLRNNVLIPLPAGLTRADLIINTKVGRYEADPLHMFDFSASRVRSSVLQSIERMKCEYIDVIQLHDPEFAPSIELLLDVTIPVLVEMRDLGLVRAIGLTGYSLDVQREIIQRSWDKGIMFDQSLTYCHYNLHDQSLFSAATEKSGNEEDEASFASFCWSKGIGVIAAAPLSMGLLTKNGPPDWHPACSELKEACQEVAAQCSRVNVDVADLAITYALSNASIPCTLLGMRNTAEVYKAVRIAARFDDDSPSSSSGQVGKLSVTEMLTRPCLNHQKLCNF
uniref:NADP-dependent oxidoreductase domain-containing protein n=1 Tax=Leptocylindrus danicus TaxID=163516 RepID=A0A7S2JT44_9STRA